MDPGLETKLLETQGNCLLSSTILALHCSQLSLNDSQAHAFKSSVDVSSRKWKTQCFIKSKTKCVCYMHFRFRLLMHLYIVCVISHIRCEGMIMGDKQKGIVWTKTITNSQAFWMTYYKVDSIYYSIAHPANIEVRWQIRQKICRLINACHRWDNTVRFPSAGWVRPGGVMPSKYIFVTDVKQPATEMTFLPSSGKFLIIPDFPASQKLTFSLCLLERRVGKYSQYLHPILSPIFNSQCRTIFISL